MKKLLVLNFVLLSLPVYSASWKKFAVTPPTSSTGTAGTALTSAQCPTNYIFVPSLSPYTVTAFCVAKYEMKDDGYGTPASVAAGTPWVSIDRSAARAKCQSLGGSYDLISNDQWQTIARNIAGVASNWSSGIVATGQINWGHSDGTPGNALAAVTDDNDPCNGTGQTCSSTVWDSQRRTHKLSNGNVIWDLSANLYEWVTNDLTVAYSTNYFVSTMTNGDNEQNRYGADMATICPARWASPYCGMGAARIGFNGGAIGRGGEWTMGDQAGIFTTSMEAPANYAANNVGFRCVFTH
ncbi:hypothetical protein SHI21_06090 [Bacteriovorax sp. PP10]|uniref:Sulfatase-modifying factor enzyme domain-containing protein n=1 Tax=Bacteriovorax antarcticus TaxID=3088717 RepID=A0ABU5VRT5_9BACT|nr:hypothetical protein [Bacteriovorax sp. PP10]MEA9355759.1 hypothetical protein [Bacteriovorax sp. PP10]